MEILFWALLILGLLCEAATISFIIDGEILDGGVLLFSTAWFGAAFLLAGALWVKGIFLPFFWDITGYWANFFVVLILGLVLAIVIAKISHDKQNGKSPSQKRKERDEKAKQDFESEQYEKRVRQAMANIKGSAKYSAFKQFVEVNCRDIYTVDCSRHEIAYRTTDAPFYYEDYLTQSWRLELAPLKLGYIKFFTAEQGERAWTMEESVAIWRLIGEVMSAQPSFSSHDGGKSYRILAPTSKVEGKQPF